MSADFSKLVAHISANLEAHAAADYPDSPVRQATFLARGGHAPGAVCPSATPVMDEHHHYLCEYPDDECHCHRWRSS